MTTVGGTFERDQSEYVIDGAEKERMIGMCSKWVPALKVCITCTMPQDENNNGISNSDLAQNIICKFDFEF